MIALPEGNYICNNCRTEWIGHSETCPECGTRNIYKFTEEEVKEQLVKHMMESWNWSREKAEKRYNKLNK